MAGISSSGDPSIGEVDARNVPLARGMSLPSSVRVGR
jgi:hypothetical protein